MPAPLTVGDFQPCNEWSESAQIPVDSTPESTCQKVFEIAQCNSSLRKQLEKQECLLIQDKSTGYFYLNIPKEALRKKHRILLGIAPLTIPFFVCSVAIKNISRTVAFCHLRNKSLTPIDRWKYIAIDIARVIALPLIAAGLALSSLYALFSPYDGEKMFTTMERLSDNTIRAYPITDKAIETLLTPVG